MHSEQLFNDCTIPHLPVDANGETTAVEFTTFSEYCRKQIKADPYRNTSLPGPKSKKARELIKHLDGRTVHLAGFLDHAVMASRVRPEQALAWLRESIRAGEWRGVEFAPMIGYVWDAWRIKGRYADRGEFCRTVALLSSVGRLVKSGYAKDSSTARHWQRLQGGQHSV